MPLIMWSLRYAGRDLIYSENVQTGNTKSYITLFYKRSIVLDFNLSQIVFPDGYSVSFAYSPDERTDIKGDHALNSITISFQTSSAIKYSLVQQYLGPTMTNRPNRLYLSQINRYANDNSNYETHSFDYYVSSGSGNADDFIPPLYFDFKDAWGYYNGDHDGVPWRTVFEPFYG